MATETSAPAGAACCSARTQETCCAADDKAECCGPDDGGCGCAAGAGAGLEGTALRDRVRDRYAARARAVSAGSASACCGDGDLGPDRAATFGPGFYGADDQVLLPDAALPASLGCGNLTAVAELRPGETVLDLGSGAGIDVLLSARRVGPTGKAYGLDMTDEMLALARANQAKAGVENVEWLRGHIEDVPLPAESVDVVISNCVINLSIDKPRVLREVARVHRPGGRFAVSDVVADDDMDDASAPTSPPTRAASRAP